MSSEAPALVKAPWTADQVESLNGFQGCGCYHPFTCGGCDNRDGLVATKTGWTCPSCDYRQDWAHYFMVDWSWLASYMAGFRSKAKLEGGKGQRIWAILKEPA